MLRPLDRDAASRRTCAISARSAPKERTARAGTARRCRGCGRRRTAQERPAGRTTASSPVAPGRHFGCVAMSSTIRSAGCRRRSPLTRAADIAPRGWVEVVGQAGRSAVSRRLQSGEDQVYRAQSTATAARKGTRGYTSPVAPRRDLRQRCVALGARTLRSASVCSAACARRGRQMVRDKPQRYCRPRC